MNARQIGLHPVRSALPPAARRCGPGASTRVMAGLTLLVLLLIAAGASAPAWTAQALGTTADLSGVSCRVATLLHGASGVRAGGNYSPDSAATAA